MNICSRNYSGGLLELDPLSHTALELIAGEMRITVDRHASQKLTSVQYRESTDVYQQSSTNNVPTTNVIF